MKSLRADAPGIGEGRVREESVLRVNRRAKVASSFHEVLLLLTSTSQRDKSMRVLVNDAVVVRVDQEGAMSKHACERDPQ